jgi:S1-C subfamily serine protease
MGKEVHPMAEQHSSQRLKTLALILAVLAVGLLAGYAMSSYSSQPQIAKLNSNITALENQLSAVKIQIAGLQSGGNSTGYSNSTVYSVESLNPLYESVKGSIVTIDGLVAEQGLFGTSYSEVLGSGFVVNLTGSPLIITNYHVVDGMINGSVTFINGEAYPFQILGDDPYSDLAVLKVQAPSDLLVPLTVVSSGTLNVGDVVIAIGNPYGLQSTMTSGIVSQLNRAIQTDISGNYLIAGMIQISTPINPGNSGGPLLDERGDVVGITADIVSGSVGVGFAVPSDAIIREIQDLVTTGSYSHSYLGINGYDLDYITAQAAGLNITYGVLIQTVNQTGPAYSAGLRGGTQTVNVAGETVTIGGDIIIQVNNQPVRTMDDLTSYIDGNTVPGQTVSLTIVRGGIDLKISVTLGARS